MRLATEPVAAHVKEMGALHESIRMPFDRQARLVGLELANDACVVGHSYLEGTVVGYVAFG